MDEFKIEFDNFKISALSKYKLVNFYRSNGAVDNTSTESKPGSESKEESKEIDTSKHVNDSLALSKSILNKFLTEIEQQRQEKVQIAVNSHLNNLLEFSEKQKSCAKQQLEKQQQKLLREKQQQEVLIVRALEQHDKDTSLQHQQLVQYYQELAEKRKKNDEELKEKEKYRHQITRIIDEIKRDQLEFKNTYHEIINMIKTCKFQSQLKIALADLPKQLKAIAEQMDEIILRCKAGKISGNENIRCNEILAEIKGLLAVIKRKVAEVSEAQNTKTEPVTVTATSVTSTSLPTSESFNPAVVTTASVQDAKLNTVEAAVKPAPVSNAQLNKFISISSLRLYSDLQNFMEDYTKTFQELLVNSAYKQFRFDCKKAVNIPVNAISAINSQHLLDKYIRLSSLLSGKVVEVGDNKVCASRHPEGIAFCTNLLAKKFVLQGDLMISSNPEAAFPYAAIISTLWNEFPAFGRLILGHFYQQCPYLVPWYPPRAVGQTDHEYYSSQGYQYTDGVVEKQDKFLKRMTGIMRLYSAIVIQGPRRGHQRNPHGLEEGWRWLSSFLNLEPKPDITATLLHVFLENAGYTFQVTYGKVFQKLMMYVYRVYLPMIQRIDSGGPVCRLESLFHNYVKEGQFYPPDGMLPPNFW